MANILMYYYLFCSELLLNEYVISVWYDHESLCKLVNTEVIL